MQIHSDPLPCVRDASRRACERARGIGVFASRGAVGSDRWSVERRVRVENRAETRGGFPPSPAFLPSVSLAVGPHSTLFPCSSPLLSASGRLSFARVSSRLVSGRAHPLPLLSTSLEVFFNVFLPRASLEPTERGTGATRRDVARDVARARALLPPFCARSAPRHPAATLPGTQPWLCQLHRSLAALASHRRAPCALSPLFPRFVPCHPGALLLLRPRRLRRRFERVSIAWMRGMSAGLRDAATSEFSGRPPTPRAIPAETAAKPRPLAVAHSASRLPLPPFAQPPFLWHRDDASTSCVCDMWD